MTMIHHQRVESASSVHADAATITTATDTSGYADSMRLNHHHGQQQPPQKMSSSKKSATSKLLAACFPRKTKTATVGIGNTCHPYHKRGVGEDTVKKNANNPDPTKDARRQNHLRAPVRDSEDRTSEERCVEAAEDNITGIEAEDATEAGTDEPDPSLTILDSRTMLESLGDFPTSDELASIAALRAREYIAECLLSTEVSSVVLDRDLWETIPQYTKMDLIVGQHLGKGTFSDVFEVIASVVEDDEPPSRTSLDLESANLDKLINKKFHSQQQEESEDQCKHGEESEHPQYYSDALDGNSDQEERQSDMKMMITNRVPRRHTAEDIARSSIVVAGTSNNNPPRTSRTLAMKCLRPQTRSNMDQFMIGVEDLVNETAMLASLYHPNIIKLHGRAGGCATNSFRLSDGFFILLDRLRDTLEDRIRSWKKTSSANKKASSPWTSQMKTACSIADAMSYLHSKNIVFRDLKPANVGFNSNGVVKLFDFGFAVRVAAADQSSDPPGPPTCSPDGSVVALENNDEETHHPLLYERCGTVRYMAPEVGLEMGYSLPADVYSYGILLWEICSLKKPFDNIKSPAEFETKVFKKGARPKLLAKEWSNGLKDVMTSCWLTAAEERPTMLEVKTKMHRHAQGRDVTTSSSARLKNNGNESMGKGSVFKKLTRRTSSLF